MEQKNLAIRAGLGTIYPQNQQSYMYLGDIAADMWKVFRICVSKNACVWHKLNGSFRAVATRVLVGVFIGTVVAKYLFIHRIVT